jgi:ribosomal protein S18 acetylase RimI-like enzyme
LNIGPFKVEVLRADHQRNEFECGDVDLDRYFKTQVTQDARRHVAHCFVAVNSLGQVAGYYTLAAASVLLSDLPQSLAKKLPRYPTVPVAKMGRLAVSQSAQHVGLGSALLADALTRVFQADVAAYAMVVDAKHQEAALFYEKHGFKQFSSQPMSLWLPMNAVVSLVS